MISVSQATRPVGSPLRTASRTASEIWSAILSGWPSVTDSEVKENERGCHRAESVPTRLSALAASDVPTSSCSGSPSSTAQTPSVIGSSIPNRCASSRSTGAVVSPSTTIPIWRTASSGSVPCAISSPARRLRPDFDQHVTTRSPMPARPANVPCLPPAASASRAISARPRATSAALALSPSWRPSAPPAASAITFFAAAHSSTPTRSSLT